MKVGALTHTGLIPTARHFTSACFDPGTERGMVLTTVYGLLGPSMVMPDWVAMMDGERGFGFGGWDVGKERASR